MPITMKEAVERFLTVTIRLQVNGLLVYVPNYDTLETEHVHILPTTELQECKLSPMRR
jgi:hypothetical protein